MTKSIDVTRREVLGTRLVAGVSVPDSPLITETLVEQFRRADLVDVSKGLIRSGLSRSGDVAERRISQATRHVGTPASQNASMESFADASTVKKPLQRNRLMHECDAAPSAK